MVQDFPAFPRDAHAGHAPGEGTNVTVGDGQRVGLEVELSICGSGFVGK